VPGYVGTSLWTKSCEISDKSAELLSGCWLQHLTSRTKKKKTDLFFWPKMNCCEIFQQIGVDCGCGKNKMTKKRSLRSHPKKEIAAPNFRISVEGERGFHFHIDFT